MKGIFFMAIKFRCEKCNEIIITNPINIGCRVKCGKCNSFNTVPSSAVEVNDSPNVQNSYENDVSTYSKPYTIHLLNWLGILNLIAGFGIGFYWIYYFGYINIGSSYSPNYTVNNYGMTVGVGFIIQGLFTFTIFNAIILIIDNLIEINKNMKKLKSY